jgi:hypothetical protein
VFTSVGGCILAYLSIAHPLLTRSRTASSSQYGRLRDGWDGHGRRHGRDGWIRFAFFHVFKIPFELFFILLVPCRVSVFQVLYDSLLSFDCHGTKYWCLQYARMLVCLVCLSCPSVMCVGLVCVVYMAPVSPLSCTYLNISTNTTTLPNHSDPKSCPRSAGFDG